MKSFILLFLIIFSVGTNVKAFFLHKKSNQIPLDFNGLTSSLFGGKSNSLDGFSNLFGNNYNSYGGGYNNGVRTNGYVAPSYSGSYQSNRANCGHVRSYNDYYNTQPSYSYQSAPPSYVSSGYTYQQPAPVQQSYSYNSGSYDRSSGYNYPSYSYSRSSGYNYLPPQTPYYPSNSLSSGITSIQYAPSVEYTVPQAPTVYTQPPVVQYTNPPPAPVVYTTPAPIVEYSTTPAPIIYTTTQSPVVYSSAPVSTGYSYETQPVSNSWSSSGSSDASNGFSDSSFSSLGGGHGGLSNIIGSIGELPKKAINAKVNAVSGIVNAKLRALESLSGLATGGLQTSHG